MVPRTILLKMKSVGAVRMCGGSSFHSLVVEIKQELKEEERVVKVGWNGRGLRKW